MELKKIITEFEIEGEIDSFQELSKGLSNVTYLIKTNQRKYILQKINTTIFEDVSGIMNNIELVNTYLNNNNYQYELLAVVKTKYNTNLFYDTFTNPWRCYRYIEHKNYDFGDLNDEIIFEFGKAIGHFHTCLSGFDTVNLSDTIPGFHNTKNYFNSLKQVMNNTRTKKTEEVQLSLMFIRQFQDKFHQINELIQAGKLPIRVCHNDTKIDNILFETNGKNIKGIIDLDTLMGNSIIYDFGDAIRASCNTVGEHDTQINKVGFEFNLFKSFAKGYVGESKTFICEAEKDLLAFSPILVTLEQAIRFFSDYLNGDNYYKINYPKQNLERGLNQIALAKKMLLKEKEMEDYIHLLFQS